MKKLITILFSAFILVGCASTVPETKVVGRDDTFIAYSNGVVKDTKKGLEWLAGPDMDMTCHEAKDWVKSLSVDGDCWRMPTLDELEAVYKSGKGTRNMTSLLKTTGWWVWSSELRYLPTLFSFRYGKWYRYNCNASGNSRAFAVRSCK